MANDYYTEWLGVAPGPRPPDHYVLLSLPRFVNSSRAIDAAAAAQLAKLDPYAIHPERRQADAATAMMNRVAAARAALTDPAQQAAYDKQLAGTLGLAVPPAPDAPDMAETAVGEVLVVSAAPDLSVLGAAEQSPNVMFGQVTDDSEALPDTLFKGHVALQDADTSFVPARLRTTGMPVALICLLSAVGLVLVAGVVVACVIMLGHEPPSEPEPPPVTTSAPPSLPGPTRGFEFHDDFDRTKLGIAYDVRAGGDTPEFGLHNGRLVLAAKRDGELVRVDVMPRDEKVLFRRATVKSNLDEGASFGVGIATAATLTVKRSGKALQVRADPGQPVSPAGSEGWPLLPDAAEVTISLKREEGSVKWTVNDRAVAVSPDIAPRAWPSLALTSAGPGGRRVTVESVHVTYDLDAAR